MKLNFKVAFPKGQTGLHLLKEVLSKGGFEKLAPDQQNMVRVPKNVLAKSHSLIPS